MKLIFFIVLMFLIGLIMISLTIYFYFKKELDSYNSFKIAISDKEETLKNIENRIGEESKKLEEVLKSYEKINKEAQYLQELKNNAEALHEQLENDKRLKSEIEKNIEELSSKEITYMNSIHAIESKIELYSNLDGLLDVGHFETPNYLYHTSKSFADEIREVRKEQKDLINRKKAIFYNKEALGTILGKKSEAKKVLEGQIKLMLLAFNEDCDLLIGKVNPRHYEKTLERIVNLANKLEGLSIHFQCQFNIKYIELKLTECKLQYQYLLKKQEENQTK